MKMTRVGILANMLIMEGGMFPGIERSYVNNDYVEAIVKAGGTPVLLPIIGNEEAIKSQIEGVDAIVISGGYDVNPLCYGEEPTEKQTFIFPERDEYELKAVKYAVELKKPILGICRGCQIINVLYGGTLYQDLSQIEGWYVKHVQSAKREVASHSAIVNENTKLHSMLGREVMINSYHHQAIKKVADGFVVSARAKDGVVEAIEKAGDEFIVGVQWHPEMMVDRYPVMLNLFKKLIEEAQN